MRRTLLAITVVLAPALVSAPAHGQSTFFLNRGLGEWLTELENGKRPANRRSAAFALGRMGSIASMAVPDLTKRIRDDSDAGVRDMAASALGDIVLSMKDFAPALQWERAGKTLREALGHDDYRVRRSAAYALGAFGPLAAPALPELKKALRDKHCSVRQNAAWALGRAGDAADAVTVAVLCDLLSDPNALVRRDAAGALETLGKTANPTSFKAAARPLLELVKSERDDVVRKTALGALATLSGPEHAGLAADVYPLLESKDPETARTAAFVLGNMAGEPARRALPELQKALRDSDPVTQELAAACLYKAGKEAAPAIDDLARLLMLSEVPAVRRNCALALGQMGRDAKSAVPALAEALKPVAKAPTEPFRNRPFEEVRVVAAEALSHIGPLHNQAAMTIVREFIRKDPNPEVRHRCIWSTFSMSDADMEKYDLVKVLSAVLEETAADTRIVRYDAARSLACALNSRVPDKACDVLLEMLAEDGLKVFKGTEAGIDATPDESKGGASKVSEKSGGDGRYMAAQALGWLGDKSRNNAAIVTALRKAAKDDEPKLKEYAKKALEKLGLLLE